MRLRWFKNLSPTLQYVASIALLSLIILLSISLSRHVGTFLFSFLSPPLQLTEYISSNAQQLITFQNLAQENKRLKNKVQLLSTELIQREEIALENERLRGLLSLPQKKSFPSQAALVIAKDSSNWTKTAIINKGSDDGVEKGAACIVNGALAGSIVEVFPFSSKITLITDFNSKIPAVVQKSREEGLLFGGPWGLRGKCKLKYVKEVSEGDIIVSSGLGNKYPKGLLIGEVIKIEEEKNNLYKIAEVKPAVDFSVLEEVGIIIEK